MKLALIPPLSMLDLMGTEIQMTLPHLYLHQEYRDHLRSHPAKTRILNNDNENYTSAELVNMASHYKCNIVIVPDTRGDKEATVYQLHAFKKTAMAVRAMNTTIKFAGVVQGATVPDAYKCLDAIMGEDWISVVMLPKSINNAYHQDRALMVDLLIQHSNRLKDREVHCLGTGPWFEEVKCLAQYPCIQSIVTTLPIKLGFDWQDIHDGLYTDRQQDYFLLEPVDATSMFSDGDQRKLINDNCRTYREWCGDTATASTGKL